jgi:hypothetical protein
MKFGTIKFEPETVRECHTARLINTPNQSGKERRWVREHLDTATVKQFMITRKYNTMIQPNTLNQNRVTSSSYLYQRLIQQPVEDI